MTRHFHSCNLKIKKMMNEFYKKFAAMAVGNVMEWFDFAAFGSLADIIGKIFFPHDSQTLQLLKSLSIFGAAFVMRPLGGIFMGWIGDTLGRRRALEISIALMLFPSFLIGCLPTYNQMGWFATFLLVILRMLQGVAVGGELVGAFVFTIEATGGQNRGLWGGACKATCNVGTSLGMGLSALLRYQLSESAMQSWGWRIPFWLCLVFGIVGLKLRNSLAKEEDFIAGCESTHHGAAAAPSPEAPGAGVELTQLSTHVAHSAVKSPMQLSPIAEVDSAESKPDLSVIAQHDSPSLRIDTDFPSSIEEGQSPPSTGRALIPRPNPLAKVMRTHFKELVAVTFVSAFWGVSYYTVFVWLQYYLTDEHLNGVGVMDYAWMLSFILNITLVCLLPVAGWMGDWLGFSFDDEEYGFRFALQLGLLIMSIVAVPAFLLISTCTVRAVVAGQLMLLIPIAIFGANLPAYMISMFSFHLRYSGVGLAYNFAHAMFSSTLPIIQTELVMLNTDNTAAAAHGILDGDNHLRPAYYLIIIAVMSTFALCLGQHFTQGSHRESKRWLVGKPKTRRSSLPNPADEVARACQQPMVTSDV